MSCEHHSFSVESRVTRLTDVDGGPVTGYSFDIMVRCIACSQPFEFVGVPMGWSVLQPMASADLTELRCPIRPHQIPGTRH